LIQSLDDVLVHFTVSWGIALNATSTTASEIWVGSEDWFSFKDWKNAKTLLIDMLHLELLTGFYLVCCEHVESFLFRICIPCISYWFCFEHDGSYLSFTSFVIWGILSLVWNRQISTLIYFRIGVIFDSKNCPKKSMISNFQLLM